MLFTGKIVEKGAFSHVGCFGDVFHGGLSKAFDGKEIQGGEEQGLANGGAAARTTVRCAGGRVARVVSEMRRKGNQ